MSEPAGWQWIEAWRNGTISDGDFHSLQILLREQSEARRTLRRSMAMDTALRDRAEARLLATESETASDEKRTSPVTAPRFRVVRREVVAWSAAAVCLLLAVLAWSRKPASDPSPGSLHNQPVIVPAYHMCTVVIAGFRRGLRDQLLASAPDVLHIRLVSGNESAAEQARGEIVWSRERQLGYLCLRGLPRTESSPHRTVEHPVPTLDRRRGSDDQRVGGRRRVQYGARGGRTDSADPGQFSGAPLADVGHQRGGSRRRLDRQELLVAGQR